MPLRRHPASEVLALRDHFADHHRQDPAVLEEVLDEPEAPLPARVPCRAPARVDLLQRRSPCLGQGTRTGLDCQAGLPPLCIGVRGPGGVSLVFGPDPDRIPVPYCGCGWQEVSVHGGPGAGGGEAFLERDVLVRPDHAQPAELFHPTRIQLPGFVGFALVGEPGPERELGRRPGIGGGVVVRYPQLLRSGLFQIPYACLDSAAPECVLGFDDPQLHELGQQRGIPGCAELQQFPRRRTRFPLTRRQLPLAFPLTHGFAFRGFLGYPMAAADAGIGEVFDGFGVVCPQRPEDFREGAVGVRGQHFVRCFTRSEEYRNDQRSNLPFTGFDSQCLFAIPAFE
ncbi:hypothetical protein EES42_41250 [Streptomyces sp. ADI95-17]|nr:hypothetical protein EES42_41250 [Streptomyces sp. ADI95-17]